MEGDTERHISIFCTSVAVENVRLETLDTLKSIIFSSDTDAKEILRLRARLYQLFTAAENRHLLWKGVVPLTTWEDMIGDFPDLSSLNKVQLRQVVSETRKIFQLTGEAMMSMRRMYWESVPRPQTMAKTLCALTPHQTTWLKDKNQTRLPQIWGIMSQAEQIDWEIKRRLKRPQPKVADKPQPVRLRQSKLQAYMTLSPKDPAILVPSTIVINRLMRNKPDG
jgi:hypothetical protein